MYGSGFDGLFTGLLLAAAAVGAVLMGALFLGLPWLWGFVKPWLHAVTG